jgi:hypothetical protein
MKKILIDSNPNKVPQQTFRPVTIIIDNNPNPNLLQDGIQDILIKRLLPKKPRHKPIKKMHIPPIPKKRYKDEN